MSGWTIYWITRLDMLQVVLLVMALMGAAALILSAMFECFPPKRIAIRIAIAAIACIAMLVFTPSTKEMVAIYVIPKVANSETIGEIGDEATLLVREWMKEQRERLTK